MSSVNIERNCGEPQDRGQHKQVRVVVGDLEAEIDEELAPLIGELWKAGIGTVMSCQENVPGIAWIEFETMGDLTNFLNIVGHYEPSEEGSLYRRLSQRADDGEWEYDLWLEDWALHEGTDDTDESHDGLPCFEFFASVRFPRCDLPNVLQRMMRHNDCANTEELDSGDLYQALIHVPTGELPAEDIFDAYLRATCVAAGIGYDPAFLDQMTEMFHQQQENADDA